MKTLKFVTALAVMGAGLGMARGADMATKAPVFKAAPAGCAYDILRANNQISVDFAATDVNYAEFNQPPAGGGPLPAALPQGATINSEKGWVPGVAVTGSYMSDCYSSMIPNLYLFARGTYLSGHTSYYNNTNGVAASDPARIWDGDFRVGKGFQVSPNVMLTPYIGAGVDDWRRTISAVPTGAFIEDYSHGYVGAGVMLQVAVAKGFVVSAYGLGGGTFSSQMNFNGTTAVNAALFGPNHTYSLGNSGTAKAGASVDYAFTDSWHVNAGVDYTYFKYGASRQELLPAFGTFEPPSRTSNVTVTAGVGYSFGGPIVARY
jgi:outer membrane protein W